MKYQFDVLGFDRIEGRDAEMRGRVHLHVALRPTDEPDHQDLVRLDLMLRYDDADTVRDIQERAMELAKEALACALVTVTEFSIDELREITARRLS